MYAGGTHKIFTEITELKTVFNFFIFRLLQKLNLRQIVCKLISIRLILFNDLMKEEGQ